MLLLAAAYYASGKLGLLLAVPPGYATAIWPPSGIALAGLLLGGYRLWPGIVAGSFFINIATSFDPSGWMAAAESVLLALTIGGGAAVEALAGTYLVERYVGRPLELVRWDQVAKFFLLGGPISCLLNASIGVGTLVLFGLIKPDQVPPSWWTWWVGDSIGVAVVAPLLLVWWAAPREVWSRRHYSVALPLVCVLALTMGLFVWVSRIEDARVRLEFDKYVNRATGAVTANFESTLQIVKSLGYLHAATPDAERAATFSTFANQTLTANPGIQALSWNPRVTKRERPSFERRARDEGLDNFHILERTPEGNLVPAAPRSEYVVVWHIEPVETNQGALGFDVASDPARRQALARACETGEAAATEPIRLVQDAGDRYGILVFSPVYAAGQRSKDGADRCGAIRGFATGVFRIHDVMRSALGRHADSNVRVTLVDDHSTSRVVWSNETSSGGSPLTAAAAGELSQVVPIMVAGHEWSMRFTATPEFRSATGTWRPWIALATGMMFAGLLSAFLLVVTGHAVIVSRANEELQREIADRKQVEKSLQENEERLRQAQKMEAVGRLAGGVAHDFNNLLTAIGGYCEMLIDRLESDQAAVADLKEIRHGAETAASLTRQLLAFSRKQILAPRIIDLNGVVLGLHEMLRRLLEENISITFHLASRPVPVQADPGQLDQVLLNLAINARDAMPQGGTLTFETTSVVLDQAYADSHPGVAPGAYVALSISDTGAGMTPEVKRNIFEPFFTTKKTGHGTGLGLATVYGIVKQSGGDIEVYSEVGAGTTFKIYFPAPSQSDVTLCTEARPQGALAGSGTVLLVEDNVQVRNLAGRILRRYGYTVISASSVQDGLRVSSQHSGEIHALLTDVVMPGGSGRELAEQLVATRPRLKVIFMSGYTDEAIVHHGVLDPGTTLLQKPFTPQALARKLRETLNGSMRA